MTKPDPVSKGENDIAMRVGTSPRLVASISVYLSKNGKYHVNLADHVKPVKTGNPKDVLAGVNKFLTAELEKDVWESNENDDD